MKDLQKILDDTTYPPTHTFTLKPLAATGLLAIRFGHLKRIAPTFFEGESLLDIGASKGFYSLWAASHGFKTVEAVEPQEQYVNLHQQIAKELKLGHLINIHQEKLGAFCRRNDPLLPRYDRVMVGNVPHYLFGEYSGHGWWKDVAALCHDGAQVLVEGPTDMRDAKCFVPNLAPELESQWNTGSNLMAPLQAGFELVGAADSPRLASDRCMMLFIRRGQRPEEGSFRRIQRETLQISRLWREVRAGRPSCHRIYQTSSGLFCKEEHELSNGQEYNQQRIQAAACSPFATPIVGFIYNRDRLLGWAEPSVVDVRWFNARGLGRSPIRNDFRAVLRTLCLYQVELASRGYLDLDCGSANWGRDSTGRMVCCDKGAVHAIDHELGICQRAFQVPLNYSMKDPVAFRDGSFFRLANREYNEWLTRGHEQRICDAIQAKDIPLIQQAFLQLHQAVGEKE